MKPPESWDYVRPRFWCLNIFSLVTFLNVNLDFSQHKNSELRLLRDCVMSTHFLNNWYIHLLKTSITVSCVSHYILFSNSKFLHVVITSIFGNKMIFKVCSTIGQCPIVGCRTNLKSSTSEYNPCCIMSSG